MTFLFVVAVLALVFGMASYTSYKQKKQRENAFNAFKNLYPDFFNLDFGSDRICLNPGDVFIMLNDWGPIPHVVVKKFENGAGCYLKPVVQIDGKLKFGETISKENTELVNLASQGVIVHSFHPKDIEAGAYMNDKGEGAFVLPVGFNEENFIITKNLAKSVIYGYHKIDTDSPIKSLGYLNFIETDCEGAKLFIDNSNYRITHRL